MNLYNILCKFKEWGLDNLCMKYVFATLKYTEIYNGVKDEDTYETDRKIDALISEFETLQKYTRLSDNSKASTVLEYMRKITVGETMTDELGGIHCDGIGINPANHNCGECNRLSCRNCVSSTIVDDEIKEQDLISGRELIKQVWDIEGVKITLGKDPRSLDKIYRSYPYKTKLPNGAVVDDVKERVRSCFIVPMAFFEVDFEN